jgi:hypothetical protein
MFLEKISTLVKYDYYHLMSNENGYYGGNQYTINQNNNLNICVSFNENGNIRLNATYKQSCRRKIKCLHQLCFNFVFQEIPTFNIFPKDRKSIMDKDAIRIEKMINSIPTNLIKDMYVYTNGM